MERNQDTGILAFWRMLLALMLAGALLGILLATWMVLADLESHTDEWDGLGVLLGAILAGLSVALGLPGGIALLLVRRHRRAALILALVTGLVLVLLGLPLAASISAWIAALLTLYGAVLAVASLYLVKNETTRGARHDASASLTV